MLQFRLDYTWVWWRSHLRGFIWLDQPPDPADFLNLTSTSSSSAVPPWWVSDPTDSWGIRLVWIVSEVLLPESHGRAVVRDGGRRYRLLPRQPCPSSFPIRPHPPLLHRLSLREPVPEYPPLLRYGLWQWRFPHQLPISKGLHQNPRCLYQPLPLYVRSDSRIAACALELGTPLTKHAGFHQVDLRGNLFGILAAHPLTSLVSLHHFDAIDPIFPSKSRVESLGHLMKEVNVNLHGILQQSLCYDKENNLSISISSGFSVQIYQGILPMFELQKPLVTVKGWTSWSEDIQVFNFNIRPYPTDHCMWNIFYMDTMERTLDNSSMMTFLKFDMKCDKPTSFVDIIQV